MPKPISLGLALLCLIVVACGPAPAPVTTPPTLQVAVPVAKVDPDAPKPELEEVDDGEPGPIPVTSADPWWGRRDAPVTIVAFEDLQCPFCARAEKTLEQLRQTYGPDKLRIVWKNNPLPFHPHARRAAMTAMAIYDRMGRDAFWSAQGAMFAEQRRLEELPEEVATRAGLKLGELLSPDALVRAGAKVDADMELGKHIGVTGTPAFFLNGVHLSGAQPIEKFTAIIDEQLQKASSLQAGGTPRKRVYVELTKAQWHAPAPPKPVDPAPAQDDRTVHRVPVGRSPVRGKAGAPVTIIEFADFQCPFCSRVAPTLTELEKRYGDKVRFVYKENPLPFHPRAEPASELALEARAQKGDAGFWAAHDLLFQNRDHLEESDLLGYAKTLGLDAARVGAALAGKKHLSVIEEDQDLADDVQASGTPHFFINGRRLVGAQPREKFEAVIDEELAKAEALIKGGVPAAKVYERTLAAAPAPVPPPTKTIPAPTRDNPSRGPAGARVVIQYFSDFQCPFCKRVNETVEALEKAFPGQIRLVWRNHPLPMHKDAELAAEAAMEAYQQKGSAGFFAMYELLFAGQGQQGGLERPALEGYAAQLGLDLMKLRDALDHQTHKAVIDADAKIAEDAGMSGTPAFVINGYYVSGAQPLAKFKKVVRQALSGKK